MKICIFYLYIFSNKSVLHTWQYLPYLTSHHSRIEAPKAEGQDFSFHSDALSLSAVWPNNKALSIRDIRWDLIHPSVALLKSYTVVFSKSTHTQSTLEKQQFNSVSNTTVLICSIGMIYI